MEIKISHLGNYCKAIIGLLPVDISPKELQVLACLCYVLNNLKVKAVTKEVKIELANMSNYKLQVTTNYLNKLKSKGLITKDNQLHPYFFKDRITFSYGA